MKTFMNWSGGKDSSLALYYILKDKNYSVDKLLTNLNNQFRRISMHGVREELLEAQANSLITEKKLTDEDRSRGDILETVSRIIGPIIGIPLQKLVLNDEPSLLEYEKQMMNTINQLREEGFTHSAFGDIFLEDLKKYRETQLRKEGMSAVFPLWKRDTNKLIHEFIDLGFKAIVVCVNEKDLDKNFCGRMIDKDFISDLPEHVDVCGENGEFHTFVFDGPIFNKPAKFTKGEIVRRKYTAPKQQNAHCFRPHVAEDYGFYFCDLLPA